MRCRQCGKTAVIHMRQHRLALCTYHYVAWFREQTERFVGKYKMFGRDDRVLVAVSGGKDSLALWEVLLALGYQADGLYIDLGIDGGLAYSDRSLAQIQAFLADKSEATLHVVDVAEVYGASIPEAARLTRRGRVKPCAVCGLVKRHVMNRVAQEQGYDVLATGHNLDDEAAVLFGNTLHWQVGYLARQAPVLPASDEGLACKVKPFFRFYERETAAYALVRGIDYVYDECPYSTGSTTIKHKMVLNQMETEAPSTKLQFYLGFLRAKEMGAFGALVSTPDLQRCPRCGQPTVVDGLCTFCRLWDRVAAAQGRADQGERSMGEMDEKVDFSAETG